MTQVASSQPHISHESAATLFLRLHDEFRYSRQPRANVWPVNGSQVIPSKEIGLNETKSTNRLETANGHHELKCHKVDMTSCRWS